MKRMVTPALFRGFFRAFTLLAVAFLSSGAAWADWKLVGPSCSVGVGGLLSPVYGFTGQDYFAVDNTALGGGYWVETPADADLAALCSSHPVSPVPVSLKAGFNLVGNPFEAPLSLAGFLDPAHEVVYVYRGNQYLELGPSDFILPGEGAWWYSDKNTSKNLMATQGSGALDTLRLIAVCSPDPNPSDAGRLVPGGAGCRLSPQAIPGECPYEAPFQVWSGGAVFAMAALTQAGPSACNGATPSPQAFTTIQTTISPSGLLTLTQAAAPLGLFPWPTANATFSLTPGGGAGLATVETAQSANTAANALSVEALAPLTVTRAVFCPLGESDPATLLARSAQAQQCLDGALPGPLVHPVDRDDHGRLSGRIALAVQLSNGEVDFVPAGQINLETDIAQVQDLALAVDSVYGLRFDVGSAVDIEPALDQVTNHTLRLQEDPFERLVVCPMTLLLSDPNLNYGPLQGALPPLPPLVVLNGSYVTGPLPSPVFGESFTIPQSSLDLCAAASGPFLTHARLGQPVSFFTAGVRNGVGALVNLGGTSESYHLPPRIAVADLPGTPGAVHVMALDSGVISPANPPGGVEVYPLSLNLSRQDPATLGFACSSQGAPLSGCAVEDNLPALTRSGTIKVNAAYNSPATNNWPDLPPLVGNLALAPATGVNATSGDPAGQVGVWWDATILALDLAHPTQDYSLSLDVGDLTLNGGVRIHSGAGSDPNPDQSLVFCAQTIPQGDSQAEGAAIEALISGTCGSVTSITIPSGHDLLISVSLLQQPSGTRTLQSLPGPPAFTPGANQIEASATGLVAKYRLSGSGVITMGIGPPELGQTFTLTVNL